MSRAVPGDYRHIAKVATPGEPLRSPDAALKLYDVAPVDLPVPDTVRAEAIAFLGARTLDLEDDFGFVILHRCGADFYFLLLQVWRGANECWEAVFAKSGDSDFADFDAAYPAPGQLRPTFCVWELGVVAHEAVAWTRYLQSPRDAAAREAWLGDRFTGTV